MFNGKYLNHTSNNFCNFKCFTDEHLSISKIPQYKSDVKKLNEVNLIFYEYKFYIQGLQERCSLTLKLNNIKIKIDRRMLQTVC